MTDFTGQNLHRRNPVPDNPDTAVVAVPEQAEPVPGTVSAVPAALSAVVRVLLPGLMSPAAAHTFGLAETAHVSV